MTDTMPEPYAYLVVYDLGVGEANTFWALDVTRGDNEIELEGHTGEKMSLSYATPFMTKEKSRAETPKHVIAGVEDCDVSEVGEGGS